MIDWLEPISTHAFTDEETAVRALLKRSQPIAALDATIRARAADLITKQRSSGPSTSIESFLQSYGLSTKEGIAMLCLAEALLRIPDRATADDLIEETFATGNWKQHLGESDSALVNASSWALMLTGSVLDLNKGESLGGWFGGLIKRSGEPVIRQALRAGMKFLGRQFVMGETVTDAIHHAKANEKNGYTISYDILGEGSRTDAQARNYVESYRTGIREIAAASTATKLFDRPGISVKLSALHPRYQETQRERVFAELLPRLKHIIRLGKECNIAVSLDAEEANRLELQLDIYQHLLEDPEFANFEGIGFVLQAYQKRAMIVAETLADWAKQLNRRIPIRLVKGAYWDSEIKHAQVMGLPGYPVFTRKEYTDLSYLACAQILLENTAYIYPQFATHNALTVATIATLAEQKNLQPDAFEFQRLHGMGESLHDQLVKDYRSRIYAPVGAHKDLLAYLIRRLIENGANSGFVHLLMDRTTSVDALTVSPINRTRAASAKPNPAIPLPQHLYGPMRKNPLGIDFGYASLRVPFMAEVAHHLAPSAVFPLPLRERVRVRGPQSETLKSDAPSSHPSPAGGEGAPHSSPVPADLTINDIPDLFTRAQKACAPWNKTPVAIRAAALRKAADLLEERRAEFIALCITEAKKTYGDTVSEIRESIDFCRYYANEAERLFAPHILPGPTGESNVLTLHGRGVFLCISPWNFPLAIFIGQVVAALVSGNAVIAKPAEQTPRIAAAAVALLHEAGIPTDVLQFACGAGETIGNALVAAPQVAGVCFTGSTSVAKHIGRALAEKDGPIVPFIAETGGINAMIVDSSALLEQACDDIIQSAFGSAGQRCSSLRILFVQEEVAPALKELLAGAMDELRLGSTEALSTDIGPIIDREAQAKLLAHIDAMARIAKSGHQLKLPQAIDPDATFVPPSMFEISSPNQPKDEQFGPILHLCTYKSEQISLILQQISHSGYGLTFGLHTRLRSKMKEILDSIPAGNRYVNRSMTGAVVGVQPFGGEGLSGTGPKAGGPHYLLRFITERTTTINSAAIGGNIELLS